MCFKVGPPELVGAELEWLTYRADAACREPNRPTLAAFAAALGPHAPTSVDPAALGLPLGHGSLVSIEPGGQVEISSQPCSDPEELCRRLCADARQLRDLLDTQGIYLVAAAADPARPASRILQQPRYRTMERHFTAIGPLGVLMMCNTAAIQVSVDAGADPADVAARWHLLHVAGPALLAAFACSPDLSGAPGGSWASQRMRTWLHLDPARTAAPIDADRLRAVGTGRTAVVHPPHGLDGLGGAVGRDVRRLARRRSRRHDRPPAHPRRPRLSPHHLVSAGSREGLPRGALHRHPTRRGLVGADPCRRRVDRYAERCRGSTTDLGRHRRRLARRGSPRSFRSGSAPARRPNCWRSRPPTQPDPTRRDYSGRPRGGADVGALRWRRPHDHHRGAARTPRNCAAPRA